MAKSRARSCRSRRFHRCRRTYRTDRHDHAGPAAQGARRSTGLARRYFPFFQSIDARPDLAGHDPADRGADREQRRRSAPHRRGSHRDGVDAGLRAGPGVAADIAIDGNESGARRLRIRAVQPELCPSTGARQDQDRPGFHSKYRDAGDCPQYRQNGHRPVPQPEIRLRGRRCGNGGAGRDHPPSRLLDNAGIFLCEAERLAADRGEPRLHGGIGEGRH